MSISTFDSNDFQIFVTMSIEKKGLFQIKTGLDLSDASSIYVEIFGKSVRLIFDRSLVHQRWRSCTANIRKNFCSLK